MSVCVYCVCAVLCEGVGLLTGRLLAQEVLPAVYRITKLKKMAETQQRAVVRPDYCCTFALYILKDQMP
jgi:hypothetical protein